MQQAQENIVWCVKCARHIVAEPYDECPYCNGHTD